MEAVRTRGLSAAWLKYLAAASMLVDHVDAIFHLMGGVASDTDPRFFLFRYFGRMAAPIFLFFVAEGCAKTHDLQGYLRRLFVFSLVAQLPYSLVFETWGGSVILTFFLGAACVWFFEALRDRDLPVPAALLPSLPLAALAEYIHSDYGWVGVVMVPALYLLRSHKARQLTLLGLSLVFLYAVQQPCQNLIDYWMPPGAPFFDALPQVLPHYLDMWLVFHLLTTLSALVPVVLLCFYRGERGRGSKWFFYVFYPAHLLVLFFIRLLIP